MTNNEAILLDINSLLVGEWTQCRALLNYSYPQEDSDNKRAVDSAHLESLLTQTAVSTHLTGAIQSELESIESLDQQSYAVLKFTDQLFDNYLKNSKLHPEISQKLNAFRRSCTKALLAQQLPWHEKTGITELFSLIYNNAIGWQPELGRAAERFSNQLSPMIDKVATTDNLDIDEVTVFFQKEQQRIAGVATAASVTIRRRRVVEAPH